MSGSRAIYSLAEKYSKSFTSASENFAVDISIYISQGVLSVSPRPIDICDPVYCAICKGYLLFSLSCVRKNLEKRTISCIANDGEWWTVLLFSALRILFFVFTFLLNKPHYWQNLSLLSSLNFCEYIIYCQILQTLSFLWSSKFFFGQVHSFFVLSGKESIKPAYDFLYFTITRYLYIITTDFTHIFDWRDLMAAMYSLSTFFVSLQRSNLLILLPIAVAAEELRKIVLVDGPNINTHNQWTIRLLQLILKSWIVFSSDMFLRVNMFVFLTLRVLNVVTSAFHVVRGYRGEAPDKCIWISSGYPNVMLAKATLRVASHMRSWAFLFHTAHGYRDQSDRIHQIIVNLIIGSDAL